MPARDRGAFAAIIGTNAYVPAMAYAADLLHGQPTQFSLGSPAAESANNIANATITANSATGTAFTLNYAADSPYGRSLRFTPSGNPGATGGTFDVFGFDYLGQAMIQRVSGTNGSTSIVYGLKAFYRVTRAVIVTPSTNAITWNIGTGRRFGLPYKGDLAFALENGIQVPFYKRDTQFTIDRSAAEAVAGGSRFVRSPFPGFVKTLMANPGGGGSTNNPVITVKLATVAITGLTVTIIDNDTTGATVTSTPSTPGYNANNRFVAGGLIEVIGTAAASASVDRMILELTPTQFSLPDLTDPNTNLLGDPRGTYEPLSAPAGTPIVVGLVGDSSVNTSGNGGLLGIRHASA